jgi:alkanesulfonate monooxygenase SsuD/methylene tetrahydromethanopterin reductase-like flavin-dependent oxidoreductase (luciferase family)
VIEDRGRADRAFQAGLLQHHVVGRAVRGSARAARRPLEYLSCREAARAPLAAGMQTFYQMPFEPFERYSPYGTPEDVAAFLQPYLEAGCSVFNVIPCADHHETAVSGVAELRRLLGTVAS